MWERDKSKKGRPRYTKGAAKGALINNNNKSNNIERDQSEIFLSESESAYDVCRRGTREVCGWEAEKGKNEKEHGTAGSRKKG